MKTLDEIKNEYAREKGFETGNTFTAWEKLFMYPQLLKEGIPVIATRFATEQTTMLVQALKDLCKEYKQGADSGDWGSWAAEDVDAYNKAMQAIKDFAE